MSIRTVVVCEAQVPFVEGGAERLVRALVAQLRAGGYLVERVALPFKWYPKEEILAHAALFTALSDLIMTYGEDAVADLAGSLPGRIRAFEFSLERTIQ